MKAQALILFYMTVLMMSGLWAQEESPAFPAESFRLVPIPEGMRAQITAGGNPSPNHEELAILGWSEDGKMAYLSGYWTPFRQDFYGSFQFIDTSSNNNYVVIPPQSTNGIIDDYAMMLEPLPGDPDDPYNLEYFFEHHRSYILNELRIHGLRPQAGFFGGDVILQPDREISLSLNLLHSQLREKDEDLEIFESYHYEVLAEVDGETLVVGEKAFETAYVLGAKVLGHAVSPFDDVIVVIVANSIWGPLDEHFVDLELYPLDLGGME